MAFENIGLGGTFSFDKDKGVQAMGQARDEFGRFKKASEDVTGVMPNLGKALEGALSKFGVNLPGLQQGIGMIGTALKNASIAALPLAGAMGFASKTAIDFEKQMGAVNAATGATPAEFKRLEAAAKRAGATTVFSATESAEAMENLAKAGFEVDDTLKALPGVMAAAAAETIPLAQATDIVAQVLRGMNLEVGQSSHVADTLAMAAAKTNTSIPELGESFKYGGSQARALGFTLEQTAAAFGVLADAGLKGSIGGTAFGSMLQGIVKPSRKAQGAIDALGLSTRTADGRIKEPVKLIAELTSKIESIKQPADRARIATTIFGVEGARAYNAFSARGVSSLDELTKALGHSSDGIGFAQTQAEKRLDNFAGAFKLFGAGIQAASIEIFGPLLQPLTASLRVVTGALNSVIQVVQDLKDAEGDVFEEQARLQSNTNQYGSTVVAVAQGIRDAIAWVKDGWASLTKTLGEVGAKVDSVFGDDRARAVSKWGLVVSFVAAAALPVVAAIGAMAFVLTGVLIPAIEGVAVIAASMFWPLVAVALVLYNQWDSLGTILTGIWAGIKQAAEPVIEGVTAALGTLWDSVKYALTSIGEALGLTANGAAVDWKEVGITIGSVIGAVLVALTDFISYAVVTFSFLVRVVIQVGKAIWDALRWPFEMLEQYWKRIDEGFDLIFSGHIIDGLKKIGLAIADNILAPIRLLVQTIVRLAEAVPGVEVPNAIKVFAKEGLTGVLEQPKPEPAKQKATGLVAAQAAVDAKTGATADKSKPPEVKVELPKERTTEVTTNIMIDGELIGKSVSKHKQEIQERAGFKATPWQRRMAVEHGSAPMRGQGT